MRLLVCFQIIIIIIGSYSLIYVHTQYCNTLSDLVVTSKHFSLLFLWIMFCHRLGMILSWFRTRRIPVYKARSVKNDHHYYFHSQLPKYNLTDPFMHGYKPHIYILLLHDQYRFCKTASVVSENIKKITFG